MESYKREVSRAFLKIVWQDGLGPTLCGLASLCLLEQALCRGAGVTARNETGTGGSQAKVWSSLVALRWGKSYFLLCHVGVAGDTGCPVPRSRILLYGTSQTLRFYKLKVCGNPKWSKAMGVIFPTAIAHFLSLGHVLVILAICQTFSLVWLYFLWQSVTSGLWHY